jgi:GTP-binding protein
MEFDPHTTYRNLPSVALVGRPNVGKSTLFNRLLHKHRAITDPSPGVTRDPVAADTFIAGKPLRLIDTGGFKLDRDSPIDRSGTLRRNPRRNAAGLGASDSLDDMVVEKTLGIIKEADLVVLLLAAGEVTAEDEEFIELLRPCRDRMILAVNKTEGGRREAEAWNLLSLGFGDIYMISAEHGSNIAELEEAIVSRLDFSAVEAGKDGGDRPPIRIALLGKPNTGKSTLSNWLTGSEASLVSEIPGTTRDVVEGTFQYRDRLFLVLDTAGIRRKARVKENIEYYSVNRAIKTIGEADLVFLLIDANGGLTDQDKKIAALAYEKGRGLILILNKWDTMPDIKNAFAAARDRVRFLFPQMDYAPVLSLCALDGKGVKELLNTAIGVYGQLTKPVETGPLNQALERWLEEYPPPVGPQTRFRLKYGVQVSVNPVKFVFFASRPQAVGETYMAYLRNRIRRDLGYSLIPIQIEIRKSGNPRRKKE